MKRLYMAGVIASSFLFSACVTIGRHIVFSGDIQAKQTLNYMSELKSSDLCLFVIIALIAMGALVLLGKKLDKKQLIIEVPLKNKRRFICTVTVLLLMAWMPYILTIAPGNVYTDSLDSMWQVVNSGHPTNNHHPMFYTLLVGMLGKISLALFGSANAGVLVYSLCQMTAMLCCIVYVLTYMYTHNVPRFLLGTSLLYYMFIPMFPNYAVTMWKDPLFSCMLLLLSVLLYELVSGGKTGRRWTVLFAFAGFGAMVFRNNGIYVFAGVVVLCIILVRHHAKRVLAAGFAAIILFMGISKATTYLWSIQGDFVENIGIPLQQLGYTINNDGEFSPEDKEYLYRLMPQEVWNYAYRPCLVDTIKWNPQFNYYLLVDTKAQFFQVWLNGLVHNPVDYIKAYLLATYGFWMIGVQDEFGYMDVFIQTNTYGIERVDLFEKLFGFSIMNWVEKDVVYIGCGTLLWVCLFACVLAMKHESTMCAAYLPALLNWGTLMIATPAAFSLRYAYIFVLGLPLYIAIPVMRYREKRLNM